MVQPGWYRGSPRERLQQGFQRWLGSPPKLRRPTLPEREQFPRICGTPRLSGRLRLEPGAGLWASLPPWFLDTHAIAQKLKSANSSRFSLRSVSGRIPANSRGISVCEDWLAELNEFELPAPWVE